MCIIHTERPTHCCSCHLKYDEKRKKKHTHSWYFRDLYAIIYYILCSVQENDSEKRYIAGLLVSLVFFSFAFFSILCVVFLSSCLHFHCVYICLCAISHWCVGVFELVCRCQHQCGLERDGNESVREKAKEVYICLKVQWKMLSVLMACAKVRS